MEKNLKIILVLFSESPEKSVRTKSTPKSSQKTKPEPSKEGREVSNEFATFLNKKLERPGVSDVSQYVKKMVDRIFG